MISLPLNAWSRPHRITSAANGGRIILTPPRHIARTLDRTPTRLLSPFAVLDSPLPCLLRRSELLLLALALLLSGPPALLLLLGGVIALTLLALALALLTLLAWLALALLVALAPPPLTTLTALTPAPLAAPLTIAPPPLPIPPPRLTLFARLDRMNDYRAPINRRAKPRAGPRGNSRHPGPQKRARTQRQSTKK